jgi:hypothetical protein
VRYVVAVDESGIERRWLRRRHIAAADVRRVHVYVDANGLDCLVVRGGHLRLVHLSPDELRDSGVRTGALALIDAVRQFARVEDDVEDYVASFGTTAHTG